jgi:hypothetical protein
MAGTIRIGFPVMSVRTRDNGLSRDNPPKPFRIKFLITIRENREVLQQMILDRGIFSKTHTKYRVFSNHII